MAAGADVGRYKVGELIFFDMLAPLGGLHGAVVLDVDPAEARLHRQPLLPHVGGREALHDQVGRVEHEHQARVVDAAVDFTEQLSGATYEIGFDLEAEGEVGAVAGLGDPADLIDRLLEVVGRVGVSGRIEGEAADQLRLEGVGQFTGPRHVLGEVLLEGYIRVLRAVGLVDKLHLADRRGDRGNVEAVLVFEVAEFLDLPKRQLHHVFDALAHVDVAERVILEAERSEGRELLDGREVEGGLVGKRREQDLGLGHGKLRGKRGVIGGRRVRERAPGGRPPDETRRSGSVCPRGA